MAIQVFCVSQDQGYFKLNAQALEPASMKEVEGSMGSKVQREMGVDNAVWSNTDVYSSINTLSTVVGHVG